MRNRVFFFPRQDNRDRGEIYCCRREKERGGGGGGQFRPRSLKPPEEDQSFSSLVRWTRNRRRRRKRKKSLFWPRKIGGEKERSKRRGDRKEVPFWSFPSGTHSSFCGGIFFPHTRVPQEGREGEAGLHSVQGGRKLKDLNSVQKVEEEDPLSAKKKKLC